MKVMLVVFFILVHLSSFASEYDGDTSIAKNPAQNDSINLTDMSSALTRAIENDSIDKVKELLASGVSPNESLYTVPVIIATVAGTCKLSLLEVLLSHGADVNKQNGIDGTAPIHWAIQNDDLSCFFAMLDAGARIDSVDMYNRNLYFFAIDYADVSLINFLHEKQLNLYAEDTLGWTVLEWAILHDKAYLFKEVLIKEHAAEG